jgi:hypothetical protein
VDTHTRDRTSTDDPRRAEGHEVADGQPAATPVVLVIRDPEYENASVVDSEVEIVDIDLGRKFDGPNGFRALSDEEQRKWIELALANAAHLREDSNVRRAVEELVEDIMS